MEILSSRRAENLWLSILRSTTIDYVSAPRMIPQEKREAVTRGLREAFGLTAFEEISQITRGRTSSLVFRIIVCGSPYLLKIITRTEDPTRH